MKLPNPKRRRRVLRETRKKLGDLKFAGFKQLASQRDKLSAAVKARIDLITRNLEKPADDFRIVPRAEWGARAPRSVSRMTANNGFVVHHDVYPMVDDSEEKAHMRRLQAQHMDTNGWADIGYNFVVFPSGNAYEGRGAGVAGAHTPNHNSTKHGVCVNGNYETHTPTEASLDALRRLRVKLNSQPVYGHRDLYSTACPGAKLYARKGTL